MRLWNNGSPLNMAGFLEGRGCEVAHEVVEQWFTFEYGGVPRGRGREVAHEVVEQWFTFEYGGVPEAAGAR
jgi:hypothetical protein